MPSDTEKELRQAVEKNRREYQRLNETYDSLLMHAHQFQHGGPQMIQTLARVNALGPQALAALKKYQEAVEALAEFYLQSKSKT
jgi:phage shock protein A